MAEQKPYTVNYRTKGGKKREIGYDTLDEAKRVLMKLHNRGIEATAKNVSGKTVAEVWYEQKKVIRKWYWWCVETD